jgi:octaprenyl-diphosphate synthase
MTAMSSAATPAAHPAPVFAGVFSRLAPQMEELDRFLRAQLAIFEPEIRPMAEACIDSAGKRIRPALVFLAGWNGSPDPTPELIRAAAVVELVHLATLVHDDIMDSADVRRGRRTAVREIGPTAAVLLGDSLFAHALNLAAQFPTTEICFAVSESARRVCAGEIMQTLRRGSTAVSRADYWRIIELKTAELFRVSCYLGARLTGMQTGYTEAACRFGRHLGVAYQIYDDLADYFGDEERLGKTLGTDLASGKMTLPLFVLLERLAPADRAALVEEIAGRESPRLGLRLGQMGELDVFSTVAKAVEGELAAARDCLRAWDGAAPTPFLLEITEVLRAHLAALSEKP